MFRKQKIDLGKERRRYLRLDTVLPVQFRLEIPDGENPFSSWVQGFTNNIGSGGICLCVNNLPPECVNLLKEKNVKISLEIDLPIKHRPLSAKAHTAWVKEVLGAGKQHLVGLDYEQIDAQNRALLLRYAWGRKLMVPAVISLVVVLAVFLGINSYLNFKLTRGNKALVEKLVGILGESRVAKEKIKKVFAEKESLQSTLKSLESRIASLTVQKQTLPAVSPKPNFSLSKPSLAAVNRSAEINALIFKLTEEKNVLQLRLASAQKQEVAIEHEFILLDEEQAVLEKANLEKMYRWLVIHQNPRTGLVMSFEGDKDIANWAFTYDEALVIQAFVNASDYSRAKKLLDFYALKAHREKGWFLNAYYASDGTPSEFVMHCGPNIWLGLAFMQYMNKTRDFTYLRLTEEVAACIMDLQNKDSDFGIRGGPNFSWYSTEHNLDAYAFYRMLFKVTQKNKYAEAGERTLRWLKNHTYDRQDLPVKRGLGDSTIATDTYAWSVAAIGPQKLRELDMDPDKILEFAEQSCSVEVPFIRPGGKKVKVKGFDFSLPSHVARGGVVSSEWTAQMIVSYKIMAEYYSQQNEPEKARAYQDKAQNYLAQLGNMIISSPSPSGQGEGCLPYATADYVDTGHGWMTPKGSNTGSVSGTTYTLFAYDGYNPLELKENDK